MFFISKEPWYVPREEGGVCTMQIPILQQEMLLPPFSLEKPLWVWSHGGLPHRHGCPMLSRPSERWAGETILKEWPLFFSSQTQIPEVISK